MTLASSIATIIIYCKGWVGAFIQEQSWLHFPYLHGEHTERFLREAPSETMLGGKLRKPRENSHMTKSVHSSSVTGIELLCNYEGISYYAHELL